MLQKITDLWPMLFNTNEGGEGADQNEDDAEEEEQQDQEPAIEELFANLRWTRVIALADFKEGEVEVFKMAEDI